MSKKATSLDALLKASEPRQQEVDLDGFTVVVRELTGRERFDLADLAEADRWDAMLWVCYTGMVDPKPKDPDELDAMRPEWVKEIADSIMNISGVSEESVEEAGEESAAVSAIGG